MNNDNYKTDLVNALENHKNGNFAEAEILYKKILNVMPLESMTLNYYGLLCQATKRIDEAINYLSQSAEINPTSEVYIDLASICNENGREIEAIDYYKKVLEFSPDNEIALYNTGILLYKQKLYIESINYLKKAESLNPDNAEFSYGLASVYHDNLNINEAMLCYNRTIELNPNHAYSYLNIGNIYLLHPYELNEFNDWTNNLSPSDINLLYTDKALDYISMALMLDKTNAFMHYNYGRILLLKGNFEKGWAFFDEGRIHSLNHHKLKIPVNKTPKWNGESLENKTIYVYETGGIGDTILFSRYLPLLKSMGAKVISKQRNLIEEFYAENDLGIDEIIPYFSLDDNFEFDFQIPNMSLARVFNTTLDNIPSSSGYLKPNPEKVANYKNKYFNNDDLKIGITWRCCDAARSVDLKYFEKIFQSKGIKIYSFQTEYGYNELDEMMNKYDIIDLGRKFNNFSDTAAALQNLDIHISIDTSVLHLAGAMGKQAWGLIPNTPDWRWMLNTDKSPWYNSLRLFRQPLAENWSTTLVEIEKELINIVNKRF